MYIIDEHRKRQLKQLQNIIGYKFNRCNIFNQSLTHSSFANEHRKIKIKHNERLEFLGDAVLEIVISDYIFNKYTNYKEGELTKLRATVVCETSLAKAAKKINIGKYILLGKGEENTGGRKRDSILADTFEAIIGAIYYDGGIDNSKKFILNNLKSIIVDAVNGKLFLDHKTQLQELLQKDSESIIKYDVVKQEGPDHNKIFHIEVKNKSRVLGRGVGRSKKEAEQSAAQSALSKVANRNKNI